MWFGLGEDSNHEEEFTEHWCKLTSGSEMLGKMLSILCYTKPILYSNSCNLYVICIAIPQFSRGKGF